MSARRRGRAVVVALAVALAAAAALAGVDRLSVEHANRRFRSGEAVAAAELYRGLASRRNVPAAFHYNLGTALLAAGDEAGAEAELRLGLRSPDSAVVFRAYHNLGSSYLARGMRTAAPDSAVLLLASSVVAHRAALRRHPGAEATRWNLALAQRALDSLVALRPGPEEEPAEEALREAARDFEQGEGSGSERPPRPEDEENENRSRERGDPGNGAREALVSAEDPGPLSPEQAQALLREVEDDPATLLRGILWSHGPKGWWWDRPALGGAW